MLLAPGIPEDSRDVVLTFAVVLSSATFSALAAALFLTLLLQLGGAIASVLVFTGYAVRSTIHLCRAGSRFSRALV